MERQIVKAAIDGRTPLDLYYLISEFTQIQCGGIHIMDQWNKTECPEIDPHM